MDDKTYWDIIRSVHYLFSEAAVRYARGYCKASQKRYYEKNKQKIIARMKQRYENNEEVRQKNIERAREWRRKH